GSEKLGIPYEALHDTVKAAFAKWASADCGGGRHPSFDLTDTDELYGKAVCGEPGFSLKTANASVWAFRDGSWPYGSRDREIAITLIQAELSTGRIFDADVQINSFGNDITTTNVNPQADLESIVTHEAGHFLGLAHSLDPDSTMNAFYSRTTTRIRTLGADDEAAICAAYPPAKDSVVCGEPEPYFGFSRYCGGVSPSTTPEATSRAAVAYGGCAIGPASSSGFSSSALLAAFVAMLSVRRRQSRTFSWPARPRPGAPRPRSSATARVSRDF
ncbi:MAG TPA: matrixin family metalloprotease, partial [Polyangiaceae bacterium]